MKANTYERQKIYAEVWEEPMRVVAQRYGISDVMLKKICVKLNIPTPPRGYWAKAKTGDAPKPSKLPKSKGETVVYGNGSDDIESVADAGVKTLASLGEREEALILRVADTIQYHPRVRLRSCLAKLKESSGSVSQVKLRNSPEAYSFDNEVSVKQVGRVAACLEELARALERIGGRLLDPFTVEVLGETVSLEIRESAVKEKHTLTKAEEKAVLEFEKNRYGWKPNIRSWDYRFNGRLRFKIRPGYQFPDERWMSRANARLVEKGAFTFDKLIADIFLTICQTCALKRAERLGKRAEERNYRERVISAQKTVDLFNDEVEKLNKALDEARRFEDAALLRRYAVEVVEHSVDLAEYASWLVEKANWIDPLTATEDPVFGDYELLGGMPEKKPNVNDALPYELKWYFDRQGYSENQTWEWFRQSVEKDRF